MPAIPMQKQDSTEIPGPGPRGPGSIVAEMFQIYGRHVARMVAIAAIVTVPLIIAGWAAFGPNFMTVVFSIPGGAPADVNETALAGVAAYSVLYALGLLAVTGAVAEAGARSLSGSNVSVGRAYGIAIRRLPQMLGASVIAAFAIGAPVSLATVLSAAIGGIIGGVIVAVTAALVAYVAVRLMFALFIALFEQAGPLTALTRSWTLVSGAWLRTFGRLLLVSFVIAIMQFALQLAGSALPGLDAVVVALIVTPLTVIGNLLIYMDLRSHKEAYTAERLASELERLPS